MSLSELPRELLLHILSFLDFKDMIRCSFVCCTINELAKDDMYWKLQCKICWNQEICPDNLTWKEYFIRFYFDFGSYLDIYGAVLKAWNQIESFIKENCPDTFSSLNVGSSEKDLDDFEERLGLKLPNDVRCVYRIHNGQIWTDNGPPVGLFGTIHNYDHFRNERMTRIEEMLNPLNVSEKRMGMLRITQCDSSRVSQFLCLTDQHGFEIGTIYCPSGYPANADFDEKNCFISDTSYLNWFTRYAQELANRAFPLVKYHSQPYIYRFNQEPGCVAVTDHVCISVATAFIAEMSYVNPPHFTFAYRITMSMDSDVAPKHSCQLETRHWVITDGEGETSIVNGPGVIGEYPIIRPGTEFSYVSCTNFKTRHGEMKGTYTFRNFATSRTSDVVVPLFHMICPEYITLKERKEKISRRNK